MANAELRSRLKRSVKDAFTEFRTKNKAVWITTCQEAAEMYAALVRREVAGFVSKF